MMNIDLKIVRSESLKPVSLMTIFQKEFCLFVSMTSNRVLFLVLKQVLSLTKLVNSNAFLISKKSFLASLIGSKRLMLKSSVTIVF